VIGDVSASCKYTDDKTHENLNLTISLLSSHFARLFSRQRIQKLGMLNVNHSTRLLWTLMQTAPSLGRISLPREI